MPRNISFEKEAYDNETTWITLIKENIFLGLNTFKFDIYE